MKRTGIIGLFILMLTAPALFGQQNQDIKKLTYQDLPSHMLKSTDADTVRINVSVQIGDVHTSITELGQCVNAITYTQQYSFPSQVLYQTGTVTVDNQYVLRAEYFITIPWSTPVGSYEGQVLYTISSPSGVCKVRLVIFTVTVVPTEAPIAYFEGSPLLIVQGSTVNFTDFSDNPVTSWAWDFGDGGTSDEKNPSHVYNDVGVYSVSLTAANHVGSDMASKEDYITVLEAGTAGIQVWEYDAGIGSWSPPAVGPDGTVYFGSLGFKLYALNPDGTEKWVHQTQGAISSIAVGTDKIYCVSQNHLQAIDFAGNRLWTYPVSGNIYDLSLGVDGTAFVISPNEPNLQAVNSSGIMKWGNNIGYNSMMPKRLSIAQDGTIYVVSYNSTGQTYVLNAFDQAGSEKWTVSTEAGTFFNYRTSPAIDQDGSVYLGGFVNFYSYNREGKNLWKHEDDGGEFLYEPAIGPNGEIYNVFYQYLTQSKVVSLSKNGSENWSFTVPENPRFLSPVTVGSDGVLYFTTANSLLYALHPDGSMFWTYQFDQENPIYVNAIPVIGDNGFLYVNYGDKLYALTTSGDGLADSPWPKSGQNIMNTGRKINPAPWLISPDNGSLNVPLNTTLEWGHIYGDDVLFDVEMDVNEDFSTSGLLGSTVGQTIAANDLALSTYYYWRVRANGIEGTSGWSPVFRFATGNASGIEDMISYPDVFDLEQNYPNPFSSNTLIRYTIPHQDKVLIKVIDINGRVVMEHNPGSKPSGNYEWIFDGRGLDAGVYFCRLEGRDGIITRRMIKIR